VLAIATALAASSAVGGDVTSPVTSQVGATMAYMAAGLWVAPILLRKLHGRRWNPVERTSLAGYAILILLAYAAVAAMLDVTPVFAAFLAGFGLVGGMRGSERRRFAEPLDAIAIVARRCSCRSTS
jgi:Kef-type K+ transport system membrane component KefB